MAGRLGVVSSRIISGEVTQFISPGLNALTPAQHSPKTYRLFSQRNQYGGYNHFRVNPGNGRGVAGVLPKSFLDDYYYRVHITPSDVDLGNLMTRQVREVEIWNAHREARQLNDVIRPVMEGVSLIEPEPAPVVFNALRAKTYRIQADASGPPVIDAVFVFNFTGEAPKLTLSGRRVVVWPFMVQHNVRETLEWKTDVMLSYKKEQRLALRQAPRQFLEYSSHLNPHQFSRAKGIAYQWSHRVYGVPVWSQSAYYGPLSNVSALSVDTKYCDYRENDNILVWESDEHFEVAQTTSVTDTTVTLKNALTHTFSNAWVMPLRFGRAQSGVSFSRKAFDITTAQVSFTITDSDDLKYTRSLLTQYRGFDVLEDRAVLDEALNERLYRDSFIFDNGRGHVSSDPRSDVVQHKQFIAWSVDTDKEAWHIRRWLHSRKGKQKAFWLPSWNRDLQLTGTVGEHDTQMVVKSVDYVKYQGFNDIMLLLKSGDIICRRVLRATNSGSGGETLYIDQSFGVPIAPEDVDLICFMSFVRFDSDRVEIDYEYGRSQIKIPVISIPDQT